MEKTSQTNRIDSVGHLSIRVLNHAQCGQLWLEAQGFRLPLIKQCMNDDNDVVGVGATAAATQPLL